MSRRTFSRVLVADTFMCRWISSGAIPATISLSILDGDDATVSTPTVVDSGNGHYFANALVNTAGYYVAAWFANIDGNDHRRRTRFRAVIEDVD